MCYAARSPIGLRAAEAGELIMRTRVLVFVIGSAAVLLGCATKQVPEESFQNVRLADYQPTDSATVSGGNGAITVSPDQVFGN
jgi:hypothetical protein